jgi:sentrin-specific protease 1
MAKSLSVLTDARFKPLTPSEEKAVLAIINNPNPNPNMVIRSLFNIDITWSKLLCMQSPMWLNDEVINFFITGLLSQRDVSLCKIFPGRKKSHFFNSFFIEKLLVDSKGYNFDNVKHWSKQFNLLDLDKVIIPINISNYHWTL